MDRSDDYRIQVLENGSLKPIQDALVTIDGQSGYTDEKGFYRVLLQSIKESEVTLQVYKERYEKVEFQLSVDSLSKVNPILLIRKTTFDTETLGEVWS